MSSPYPVSSTTPTHKNHTAIATDKSANTVTDSSDNDSREAVEDIDGDYGSYGNHIFSDPKVAAYWANIYENATYEGRHRFDPAFTWSATEEKRLKRKVRGFLLGSILLLTSSTD